MTGHAPDSQSVELRAALRHAHQADADRADVEVALLRAQAEAKAARARESRTHADAVNDRAALDAVLTLCAMTIRGSCRVQARQHAQDIVDLVTRIRGSQESVADGAWGTVWLEGKWQQLTSRMTTEQRELVIWERQAHRVVETRERDLTDWPEEYREKWVEQGMPDPAGWSHRPFVIVLHHDENPAGKPVHLLGPAGLMWRTLPEHYAICRLCHELPPCRHVHNEKIAQRAAEQFEKEMAILPGHCHACREPITRRQKSVRFTGPNLIRPDLGDDSAVFHLRAKCHGSVRHYDERWAQATGKPRQFFCEGTITVHQGGETDCTELAACPGDVDHRARIWHRPESAVRMKATGCWCLASATLPTPTD